MPQITSPPEALCATWEYKEAPGRWRVHTGEVSAAIENAAANSTTVVVDCAGEQVEVSPANYTQCAVGGAAPPRAVRRRVVAWWWGPIRRGVRPPPPLSPLVRRHWWPFSKEQAKELEDALAMGRVARVQAHGQSYEVDPAAGVQTNTQTGTRRYVGRTYEADPNPSASLADVAVALTDSERQQLDGDDECPICFEQLVNAANPVRFRACAHNICQPCLEQLIKTGHSRCPQCSVEFRPPIGTQPLDGSMEIQHFGPGRVPLDGHQQDGTIVIEYAFPNGVQGPLHPEPGKPYRGANRTAYLPDTPDGQEVLGLLKRAFQNRVLFAIDRSNTTMRVGVVWAVHHKTSPSGGTAKYGYPDAAYFTRVKEELATRGIK